MARHRNIRNYAYEEDMYEDVYGHSVEEHDICVSPTTAQQFLFHRGDSRNPNLSSFMEEPIEQERDSGDDEGHVRTEEEYKTPNLDKESQAKLNSCMDQFRSILGENCDDLQATAAIIKHDFDLEKAIDEVLDKGSSPDPMMSYEPRREKDLLKIEFLDSQSKLHRTTPFGASSLSRSGSNKDPLGTPGGKINVPQSAEISSSEGITTTVGDCEEQDRSTMGQLWIAKDKEKMSPLASLLCNSQKTTYTVTSIPLGRLARGNEGDSGMRPGPGDAREQDGVPKFGLASLRSKMRLCDNPDHGAQNTTPSLMLDGSAMDNKGDLGIRQNSGDTKEHGGMVKIQNSEDTAQYSVMSSALGTLAGGNEGNFGIKQRSRDTEEEVAIPKLGLSSFGSKMAESENSEDTAGNSTTALPRGGLARANGRYLGIKRILGDSEEQHGVPPNVGLESLKSKIPQQEGMSNKHSVMSYPLGDLARGNRGGLGIKQLGMAQKSPLSLPLSGLARGNLGDLGIKGNSGDTELPKSSLGCLVRHGALSLPRNTTLSLPLSSSPRGNEGHLGIKQNSGDTEDGTRILTFGLGNLTSKMAQNEETTPTLLSLPLSSLARGKEDHLGIKRTPEDIVDGHGISELSLGSLNTVRNPKIKSLDDVMSLPLSSLASGNKGEMSAVVKLGDIKDLNRTSEVDGVLQRNVGLNQEFDNGIQSLNDLSITFGLETISKDQQKGGTQGHSGLGGTLVDRLDFAGQTRRNKDIDLTLSLRRNQPKRLNFASKPTSDARKSVPKPASELRPIGNIDNAEPTDSRHSSPVDVTDAPAFSIVVSREEISSALIANPTMFACTVLVKHRTPRVKRLCAVRERIQRDFRRSSSCVLTPFDFSTPSPDDVVTGKQKGAFRKYYP